MLRHPFLPAFLVIFSTIQLSAQIGGSVVFPSLDLPLSARAAALGGKAVALNDNDLNLATWNPSLLNHTMSSQVTFSFSDYMSDIKYGYFGFAWHFEKAGTFALNATRINYGNFRETDNTGQVIGEFSAGEYGVNLGYSKAIDSNFTFGANLKFIQSNLYLWKANGLAIDMGAAYKLPKKNFTASVLMRNMGRMMRNYTGGNREKLPFEVEAGIAFKPKHMPFRFNITLQHLQKWDLTFIDPNNPPQLVDPLTGDSIKVSKFKTWGDKAMRHVVFGSELLIGKAVSIRFGYNYMRRKELMVVTRRGATGFTFGLGIRIFKIHLSYARVPYHLAGPTNTFTITTTLSDFYVKK
ncbi:MAG TPA: type IX secretion system protein PorQ [Bacteroidia bacterium]|nr:type IX secretion system protein PorQ [Bacteroidia bacterium]